MAKSAKATPAETEAPVKPKSKRLLLAIIGVLILGGAGGAGWYFMKGAKHVDEPKVAVVEPPTFLVLDPFTVNLQHEDSDQYLNIGITLKVASADFADKIRQRLPEVRSRLLFLLSSKRPSELMPIEGKKKLSQEITAEINAVLGLVGAPPQTGAHETNSASGVTAPDASGVTASSSVEPASAVPGDSGNGVQDVLFTSFIIQ